MTRDVVPAKLGWSNPDTGAADLRMYATDQGGSPRWARPRARVVEDALIEHGRHEGDRFAVVHLGDRFTENTAEQLAALIAGADERAAALVERMCDWTSDFKGTRTVIEPDHARWHLGYACPYDAMAAVLRGQPDPRRQEPNDG